MEILELIFHFCERPLVVGVIIVAVIVGIVLFGTCEEKKASPPPPPKCQKYTPQINVKLWKVEVPVQVGTKCRP